MKVFTFFKDDIIVLIGIVGCMDNIIRVDITRALFTIKWEVSNIDNFTKEMASYIKSVK